VGPRIRQCLATIYNTSPVTRIATPLIRVNLSDNIALWHYNEFIELPETLLYVVESMLEIPINFSYQKPCHGSGG
jgi:hypothetical protein